MPAIPGFNASQRRASDAFSSVLERCMFTSSTSSRPGEHPGHADQPLCDRASILLIDDNRAIVEVFTRAITAAGIDVVSAPDGRRALAAVHGGRFHLWLLETKLPDLHGLDVVRELRARGFKTPFIVASGSATIQTAVEAMKLGARAVLEKPVRLEELRNIVCSTVASARLSQLVIEEPHTPSERWCNQVIRLITADHDLKTESVWAKHVGVSLSTLRACCRQVNVKAEDTRNLARALRAILRCGEHWSPETVLDIDDARTLRKFEERSGIARRASMQEGRQCTPSVREFFAHQTWVPRDNTALIALCRLMLGPEAEAMEPPVSLGTDVSADAVPTGSYP
jgi:DNA-binding response OmpR family regulator